MFEDKEPRGRLISDTLVCNGKTNVDCYEAMWRAGAGYGGRGAAGPGAGGRHFQLAGSRSSVTDSVSEHNNNARRQQQDSETVSQCWSTKHVLDWQIYF
jgi:hypothetical protein